MLDLFICLVSNLLRIYVIRKFVQTLVSTKNINHKRELVVTGLYFVCNTVCYLLFHYVWINVLTNIIGISVLTSLYSRSIKTNIFVTSSVYLVNVGCDALIVLLFVNYQEGSGFQQIYAAMTVFLIFICQLITEKIVSFKSKEENSGNLLLALVPVCSIFLMFFMTYNGNMHEEEMILLSIGLLIINFLTFYLYNMTLRSFVKKYENDILQQKVIVYSNQLALIMENEDKVKSLKHDIKHHLNELKLLVQKCDKEGAEKYLGDMIEFLENPNEIVSSGNVDIDSVINYMLYGAKQKLSKVEAKVQLPEKIVHTFDVNMILGNLLENAIDAAESSPQKELYVNIIYEYGVLKIQIKNSFLGKQSVKCKKENERMIFFTTKEREGIHGIGLNNVNKIVEKYKGIMKIEQEEKYFIVDIIIYM